MGVRIINADVLDGLRQLEDESVHCVVTSPPYWGLRDYNADGQIGLEETPQAFVARLVGVFREVRRVLRKDGTCWVNLGDSYAAGGVLGRKDTDEATLARRAAQSGTGQGVGSRVGVGAAKPFPPGFKPKDLIGIPWRVAFALQADGWWLRSDIIWAKPNPMPESVTDRPTKAHEYVFLLTKSERYFYDAEAIKEPRSPDPVSVARRDRADNGAVGTTALRGQPFGQSGKGENAVYLAETSRNKRSVWTVATAPYSEAHFATFPPDLIEPMILAGTSAKGCCAQCGSPWEREVERTTMVIDRSDRTHVLGRTRSSGTMVEPPTAKTIGWLLTCECEADVVPCTVLDPFSGAGTTALVADRLQRNAIGVEINPDYVAMSQRRIDGDRGGLLDLMEGAA